MAQSESDKIRDARKDVRERQQERGEVQAGNDLFARARREYNRQRNN